MDSRIRGRRPILKRLALAPSWCVFVGAITVGCHGTAPSGIGVSSPRAKTKWIEPDGGKNGGPSRHEFSEYRAAFSKLNRARFVSQGHLANRFHVDVWANESAKRAYEERASFPVGSTFLKEHFEVESAMEPSAIYVMQKKPAGFDPDHGDWRYVVVDNQGKVFVDGPSAKCFECHMQAPKDAVFGLIVEPIKSK